MKQIIIVKPNSLSETDKQQLKDNNVILIEHVNPSEVRIIQSMEGFEGDDLLGVFLKADEDTNNNLFKANFAQALFKKLREKTK